MTYVNILIYSNIRLSELQLLRLLLRQLIGLYDNCYSTLKKSLQITFLHSGKC